MAVTDTMLQRERAPFPVGFYHLHEDPIVNFEMNRWISYLGVSAVEDMRALAPRLTDFPAYRREFLALAERMQAAGQLLKAAFYYRSADFFTWADDPAKGPTRRKFLDLIRQVCAIKDEEYYAIPYQGGGLTGVLPAYSFTPSRSKGTIVVHGGFDSYMEEFFPLVFFLTDAGYDVILFEGPGQGGALEESHLPMTHEWEKPIRAVLDYFQLDSVIVIGISLGGCLALRAAACEQRIRGVVAYDALYSFLDVLLHKIKEPARTAFRAMLKTPAAPLMDAVMARAMEKSLATEWMMRQGMHVLGVTTPSAYLQGMAKYTTASISPLVEQDVLLLADPDGNGIDQFFQQMSALIHARSLTGRVFSRAECASHHCQVGNVSLALRVIVNWIDATQGEARRLRSAGHHVP